MSKSNLGDPPDVAGVVDLVVDQHVPEQAAKSLLWDGDVSHVVLHAPLLVLVKLHPPLLFHGRKHTDIKRLSEMCRVGGKEDEADIMFSAQLHDVEAEVGSQIVTDKDFHFFFGNPALQPNQKHLLEEGLKFLNKKVFYLKGAKVTVFIGKASRVLNNR